MKVLRSCCAAPLSSLSQALLAKVVEHPPTFVSTHFLHVQDLALLPIFLSKHDLHFLS